MKTAKFVLTILAFVVLTATVAIIARNRLPKTSAITLTMKDCRIESVGELKAKKGTNISVRATANQDGEWHIHGYDLKQTTKAGEEAVFNFRAVQSGIFDLTHHNCEGEEHPMLIVLNDDGSEPSVDEHEQSGEHKAEEEPHGDPVPADPAAPTPAPPGSHADEEPH